MKKQKKLIIFLLIIFFLGLIAAIPHLLKPMIAEPDAYSRVNLSIQNQIHSIFFSLNGGTWLPLHFTILSSFIAIFGHFQLTPRVVTLIFCQLSSVLLFFYTDRIYQNKKIAALASLLYLIWPLRFFLSTQTLSEPIFIFWLLAALILIQPKKIGMIELAMSGIALNIAHGIRYESWFLLPIIWAIVYSKNINQPKKIFYFVFSVIFPLIWIYVNGAHGGDYLLFFNEKYQIAQINIPKHYFNLFLSYQGWEEKLNLVFPFLFIFTAFYDYKKITLEKIAPVFLFVLLVVQAFFGTMEWFPTRYLFIPLTLLFPMLASSLYELPARFQKIKWKPKAIALTVLILLIPFFYLKSFQETKLELEDYSFLSDQKTLSSSHRFQQFSSIVVACKFLCKSPLVVFEGDGDKSYLGHSIIFFSEKNGRVESKSKLPLYIQMGIPFIWEKEFEDGEAIDESSIIGKFKILYENESFFILN